MTHVAAAAPAESPIGSATRDPGAYRPGVCNIGAYERSRRLRAGLVGVGVAAVLAVLLLVVDAPQLARGIVLFPLWGGLVSLLQAHRRFCVGFAYAGLENFGDEEAARRRVVDEDARAADRRTAIRLIVDGLLIAAPLTAAYVLLPL